MATAYQDCTLGVDGVVTMDEGAYLATITSDPVDGGSVASRRWSVLIDSWEEEDIPIEDLAFTLGSGEARVRTMLTREASPGAPGADFDTHVEDLVGPIGELQHRCSGPPGTWGANTRALVEARWSDDGSSWTDYGPWSVGLRTARYAQIRVTLERTHGRYQRKVSQVLVRAAA